ncbi:hypothetical protein ILYODFUR_013902 [Ilyodon furcidens]|uniref:Uncharacterized protein n=1 Tax=Ilyodon furcidens TaxID=33524 RepID=A0ABV0TUV0_9TELE
MGLVPISICQWLRGGVSITGNLNYPRRDHICKGTSRLHTERLCPRFKPRNDTVCNTQMESDYTTHSDPSGQNL